MLCLCATDIHYMIKNQKRVDRTLIFDLEDNSKGHQGKFSFPSIIIHKKESCFESN